MQWSLIKTWAKEHNFTISRTKCVDSGVKYDYFWYQTTDKKINGTATSLSKLATILFNSITDNKFIEYQKEYQEKLHLQEIDHHELSGQW